MAGCASGTLSPGLRRLVRLRFGLSTGSGTVGDWCAAGAGETVFTTAIGTCSVGVVCAGGGTGLFLGL